jgi:hypothetical protein
MRKNQFGLFLAASALVILGLAVLPACKRTPNEKMAEKMMERGLEKATGQKTDVDLAGGKVRIQGEGGERGEIEFAGAKWPEDLPEGVIKFEDGKIKGVTRGQRPDGKSWMVIMENVKAESVSQYVEALKAEGWTVPMNMTMEKGGMFQAEKEKVAIIGTFNGEDKICSLSIMLRND